MNASTRCSRRLDFARAPRLRSVLVAIGCAGAVQVTFEPPAKAEQTTPFHVSLRYRADGAAERCWDEAEFRRNVVRAVGYDPFRPDASVSVEVQLGGSTDLVDGRFEWRSSDGASMGERRFLAKDGNCPKLLTEMSFAIALQIELLRPKPNAAASTPTPASQRDTSSGAPASTAPPPEKPRRAAPAPTPARATPAHEPAASSDPAAFGIWVGLGPSLAWGISPALTGQARLFLGARRSAFSLELGVEGTLPVVERQADGSGFRQSLIGAGAAFCAHHAAFAACLLGKASKLRVSGLDVDQPQSPTALIGQAGARLAAAWEISESWSLTPHIDALALLTPRAVSLNRAEAWEMPLFSFFAGIDVVARFR